MMEENYQAMPVREPTIITIFLMDSIHLRSEPVATVPPARRCNVGKGRNQTLFKRVSVGKGQFFAGSIASVRQPSNPTAHKSDH